MATSPQLEIAKQIVRDMSAKPAETANFDIHRVRLAGSITYTNPCPTANEITGPRREPHLRLLRRT